MTTTNIKSVLKGINSSDFEWAADQIRMSSTLSQTHLSQLLLACTTKAFQMQERRGRPQSKKTDPFSSTIEALLSKGAQNHTSEFLIAACTVFCPYLIRALKRAGHSLNATDEYGYTTLMAAVDHKSVCRMVLQSGINPLAVTQKGYNALHILCKRYARPDSIPLLLDAGIDIHARAEYGWTALMLSARTNRNDTLCSLLQHGALVTQQDTQRRTALTIAREHRSDLHTADLRAWKTMQKNPSQVNRKFAGGITPLMFSPLNELTITSLLEEGARVNARDVRKMTPLMHQCTTHYVRFEAIAKLIDAGANVNARDTEGRSAIHFAARDMKWNTFFKILNFGFDPKKTDKSGNNALDYARKGRNRELVFRLESLMK